ncbi:hypothetical protein [Sphaerothrix gracilis]|uniref:hypothetical protein n=1 Tax=Sphaerothrix gracilis TaxID=3151835 RepID=UPI0031FCB18D
MTDTQPLELALDEAIAAARVAPQTVKLEDVWQQFAAAIAQLPLPDHLRLGALLIAQLAQLYELKAGWLLDDWEDTYHPQDPIFSDEMLQGLVRQSQQVDVSMFTEPVRRRRSRSDMPKQLDSVADTVDKQKVLAMVDQMDAETAAQQALMTAHAEQVSVWIRAIAVWMTQQQVAEVSLMELHQALNRPLIEVWLGLLLGNYALEQRGEFYSPADIRIKPGPKSSDA